MHMPLGNVVHQLARGNQTLEADAAAATTVPAAAAAIAAVAADAAVAAVTRAPRCLQAFNYLLHKSWPHHLASPTS
jgi:hypothetical protein